MKKVNHLSLKKSEDLMKIRKDPEKNPGKNPEKNPVTRQFSGEKKSSYHMRKVNH